MKKQILFLVMMLLPMMASAQSSVKIDDIYYMLNTVDKTAEVTRGGYSGVIVIPSTVTKDDVEYTVTSIASNAFYNSPQLTSVTIPKSVTTIKLRRNFFYNCNKLTSIVVEEGNPNYDSREGCNALIETASNKLLYGANNSFIPNSITTIGVAAFEKRNFTTLSIPNSVTTIEDEAFASCSELTSVYIGTGLENIGEYIFEECNKLKTVEINSNALVSKNYTSEEKNVSCLFWDATVEEIVLGEEVTSVGDYAFSGSSMKSIKMSDNLISIGNYAFWQCRLTSIDFSNNLEYIGKWAFAACFPLPSVTIPESVKCIDFLAFQWCNALTKVVVKSNEVVARDNDQFYTLTSCFGKQVEEYVLGEDVKKIAYIAFAESDKLTSVTISNYLTCIDDSAFHMCTSLTDVYCYAEQVPETGKDVFLSSNYTNATLHVPASSVEAYKNAEQWKDFKEIVALPTMDDYCMMVKDGKVWKTGIYGSGNPVRHVEYFYFDGDTVIDGKTCKQMMCQQYYNDDDSQHSSLSYVGAWYEEDKKVYTYDTTNKQFVLKYDFSVDANDTLQINQEHYRIGPWQIGGIKGFKGVYRDVWFLAEEGPIYSPSWLEGVGSIDGPTVNVYPGYVDPLRFLMSCTVDDEVIYFNDGYEDGATPEKMNANKHRFDFTHTVKTQPKAPGMGGEERPKGVASADTQSIYGEYSQQQLSIHLEPLDETYVVCITNESNEVVYEKTINTVGIVGLNIDISTYAKGCYTATVENSNESFVGEFEMQATGNDITLSCPDDNHPHAIDLGLPSGTKWACCNVGASTPEGYGGYYAWGETEEKDYYSLSTYIHYDDSSSTYHDLGSDIAGTQYDVAHVKWGGSWVMPSKDQNQELIENCNYEWIIVNDVMGAQFTGPSGGTIFLPAAGNRSAGDLYYAGSSGYNWSSTQEPPYSYSAYRLYFNWYNAYWSYGNYRYCGHTVRPIIGDTNGINLPNSSSEISNQAIYNIYGIKVASNPKEIGNLPSGVYIFNGKKIVIK